MLFSILELAHVQVAIVVDLTAVAVLLALPEPALVHLLASCQDAEAMEQPALYFPEVQLVPGHQLQPRRVHQLLVAEQTAREQLVLLQVCDYLLPGHEGDLCKAVFLG